MIRWLKGIIPYQFVHLDYYGFRFTPKKRSTSNIEGYADFQISI